MLSLGIVVAIEQALGADLPVSGLYSQLHGRVAQAPRWVGVQTFGSRAQRDQRHFWCLFGVYYWRAPERGEGIRETKEKFIKFKSNSYLRASPLLTET